jgi:hypothetical protein
MENTTTFSLTEILERDAKHIAAFSVRAQRYELLSVSDVAVIRAYEQNTAVSPEWVAYRQALRDITLQEGFPENVVWPEKPE